MSQLRRLLGCAVLTAYPIAACSLINHFDGVVPKSDAGAGASSGVAAAAGAGADAGTGDTSGGGSAGANSSGGGSGGSGGKVSSGGGNATAGEAGASSGGSSPTVPAQGVLAVAGTDPTKGDANVVSLIDPKSGKEFARQTLTGAAVAGLAYDGAAGKDAWFEFTAATFPAATDTKSDLQVYSFNDADGSWKVISSRVVTALPAPRPDSFVVLNDRLSYLSYDTVSGMIVDSLTVLDTSDLTKVTQIKFTVPTFGGEVLGMVGTRGAPGDPTATGGTLAVLVGVGCANKAAKRACTKLQLLPVFVGSDTTTGLAKDLSVAFGGQPAFTSAQSTQLAYVVSPPALAAGNVKLQHFDPRALGTINQVPVALVSRWLGGLAYAECQDVALFTAVAEGQLYAVSPSGLTQDVDLGYAGQSVVYEPFTGRVFTLFNSGNAVFANSGFTTDGSVQAPAISAFDVSVTGGNLALAATAAAKWKPPANIAPNLAVARFPVGFPCK